MKKDMVDKPYQVVEVPVDQINRQVYNKKDVRDKYSKKYLPIFNIGFRTVGIIRSDQELNFDKDVIAFEDYPLNNFKKRFVQNKDWKSTTYYNSFSDKNNSKGRRGIDDWNEFKEEHLLRWDKVFHDLKKYGYKTQKELSPAFGLPENEIQVCVNREGKFLFIDGRHRLAMARILNLKSVPVIVNFWSKELLEVISKETEQKKLTPEKIVNYILKKSKVRT